MKTHSIRLDGPWQFRVSQATQPADVHRQDLLQGVIRLPADWPAFFAACRSSYFSFSRSFNFPATLAESERCELCFERLDQAASVSLNESPLVPIRDGHSAVCEIKEGLRPVNRLQIGFAQAQGEEDPIPFENVSLCIRQI